MKNIKLKIMVLFVISILSLPLLVYYFTPDVSINKPNEIVYNNSNDEVFFSTIQNKPGKYVKIDDIDKNFLNYLLCIEDKDFYNHKGFDLFRIISSLIHNISSSSLQGASTITMQLARLLYLNQDQTLERKIQELAIAIKLERHYSKDKILECYVNNVYFAHGIYGIGNASEYYFNKSPKELSIKESAVLIGIINAPNLYSPFIDLNASNKKAESILRTLHDNNLISIKDYYSALYQEIEYTNHNNDFTYIYPYYVDSIKEELNKIESIDKESFNNGFSITSYLNQNIQNYIEQLIANIELASSDVAIVIMEVNSGNVVGLIGGKDYKLSSFNRAKHAKKQIGSTIKPLLYYLALRKGLSPLQEFTSKKTTFKLDEETYYEVSNANNIYANRKITMIEAIAMSDNIYAMKTMLLVNEKSLINLLNAFNVDVDVNNITLALGSNSLTPLELTSIYNTIASDGIYYKPSFIKEIKSSDNKLIYRSKNSSERILHKETNKILQYLLRAPFDSALKSYASPSLMNYYVSDNYGAKTGSTESSSWVMGFSKTYTIGVYVGSDNNDPINNAYLSRIIFHDIAKYLDKKDEGYFDIPSSLNTFKLYNNVSKKHSFTYLY